MTQPLITDFSPLDKFFFYFFLPTIVVFVLGVNRLYFRLKKPEERVFKISRELIWGNIVVSLAGFTIGLFLYFYILDLDASQAFKWDFLTLVGFILLSFPLGIGAGTHVVAVSVRKLLEAPAKNHLELTRAIHFFHYPFSHNAMFSSALLMGYLVALLDFFKGRSLDLNWFQIGLVVGSGVIIGTVAGILFIITKCHRLIWRTTVILLLSLGVMTLGESRTLVQHPVTLLFAVGFLTITVGILLYRQTQINLRPPVKRAVKKWLQWDIDYL